MEGHALLWRHEQRLRRPRQRQQLPQAEFWIVGSKPGAQVQQLQGIAGVHVTGRVPDVRPYLATPMLVVWGDYVPQAPRWAPRLVNCRAFAAKVNAAGGRAENLVLPDIGIRGNSHMLMQDDNSHEIAGLVLDWVRKNAKR